MTTSKISKIQKIEDKFKLDADKIQVLHPYDYLKLIKDVCSFLEKQLNGFKKECSSPFRYQHYKQQILADWEKFSPKINKILLKRIKETQKSKGEIQIKLNTLDKFIYQYWWQTHFYLTLTSAYYILRGKKNTIQTHLTKRKELESIVTKYK